MAMSRSLGSTSLTTRSPMRISPPVIVSSPAIMRRAVDLAAARRPDEHQELAVGDLQVEVVDGLEAVVVDLVHLVEDDFAMGYLRL